MSNSLNLPSPPDIHIPQSPHTVSVSIINTTSTIHGAKTSDFFGPPIKGHKWLAAPVFCFLIQHHEYEPSTGRPIPGRTRTLLFDLGIRKDWWNSAPSLVNTLRCIRDPPWTLETKASVRDILATGRRISPNDNDVQAVSARCGHDPGYLGPITSGTNSGRGPPIGSHQETETEVESGNNSNIATQKPTTITKSTADDSGGHAAEQQIHQAKTERDSCAANIDIDTIEAIIWSHHHFDHTGDPSLFPLSTALIVGPGVADSLLPGYPDDPGSSLLKSDYEGRELIELDFGPHVDTGTDNAQKIEVECEGGKGEAVVSGEKRFKTITIGQLPAIDYFGDGSLYLLDTPGHAVGHICALARVTSSTRMSAIVSQRPDMDTPDTFVLLAGDAFHHPGELRPSEWLRIPDKLAVTVDSDPSANKDLDGKSRSKIHLQDVTSTSPNSKGGRSHRHHGAYITTCASSSHDLNATQDHDSEPGPDSSHGQGYGCATSAPRSGSVPSVSLTILPLNTNVGAGADMTGYTGSRVAVKGRVVSDDAARDASESAYPRINRGGTAARYRNPDADMPVGNVQDNIMKRSVPGVAAHYMAGATSRSESDNGQNFRCTSSTAGKESSDSGQAADSHAEPEVLSCRKEQFTIPGAVFTALLPPQPDLKSKDPSSNAGPATGDEDGWFQAGNSSFYCPSGSQLCQRFTACSAHKLECQVSPESYSHTIIDRSDSSREGPVSLPLRKRKDGQKESRGWHHDPVRAAQTLHKLQEFDAQKNILILAAHDESLLDLNLNLGISLDPEHMPTFFPKGTLDNWFEYGLKDKLTWVFLRDFIGAIPSESSGSGTGDGEQEEGRLRLPHEPSVETHLGKDGKSQGGAGFDSGYHDVLSEEDRDLLTMLNERWEKTKDYWAPVDGSSVSSDVTMRPE